MAIKFLNSVNADSGVLYVDADNNRVGIGTTSPASNLDVNGDTIVRGRIYFDGTTSSYIDNISNGLTLRSDNQFKVDTYSSGWQTRMLIADDGKLSIPAYGSGTNTGTATYALSVDANGNIIEGTVQSNPAGVDGTGTVDYLTKWLDGDTLTDSNVYEASGDLVTTLNLKSSSSYPQLKLTDTDNSTTSSIRSAGGSLQHVLHDATKSHVFYGATTADELVRITGGGLVGIGQANPVENLEVYDASANTWVVVETGLNNAGTQYVNTTSAWTVGINGANSDKFYIGNQEGLSAGKLILDTSGNLQLTAYGVGLLTSDASGNITLDTNTYLTEESDTLATVTGRGATTSVASTFSNTLTVSGGGNTLLLKKGTGNPALAFAGTSDEASALIEGIAGGGIKFYVSDGGTLSTPAWSAKMTIINDGKIGIGTTSPTQDLHVVGNFRLTGEFIDSNNSGGLSGQILSSTGTGTDWVSLSEIQGVDGTGTANYLAKWSDIDTITDSVVYDDGTNVGIGTSSPATKLHITGDITGTNKVLIENTNNGTNSYAGLGFQSDFGHTYHPGILLNSSTNTAYGGVDSLNIWQYHSKPITLVTNNVVRAIVTGGGDVGIGTTAPNHKLEVAGNIGVDNYIYHNGDTNTYVKFDNDEITLYAGNHSVLNYAESTASTFDLGFGGQADTRIGAGNAAVIFQGGSEGSYDGKVGIGTTTPNVLFDVNKSTIGEYAYFGSGLTRQLRLSSYNTVSDHAGHKINASSGNGEITLATNSIAALTVKNNQTLQFNAYTTGVLVTDANGNVSASTAYLTQDTADDRYVLEAGDTMTGDLTMKASEVKFTDSTNNIRLQLGNITGASPYEALINTQNYHLVLQAVGTGQNDIKFRTGTSSGADRMIINEVGNVGIGTTSPNYKLDVNGEAQLGYINFEYNSNYAGIRWKDSAYNLQWKLGHDGPSGNWLYLYDYAMSASAFTFKPNGDMLFTPGGNVGIGTTSPSSTLTVNGAIEILKDDISSTSEGGHLTLRAGSAYSYRYSVDNFADKFRIFRENDSDGTNGLVFMQFDSSGNLRLNQYGAGYLKTDASGNITADNSVFLTAESDTLDTVTGRGNTTSNAITTGSITAQSSSYVRVRVDQTDSALIDMGVSSGGAEGFLNVQNTGTNHSTDDPELKLLLNSTEYARLNATGFGIGTTDPTRKLHVNSGTTNHVATFESTDSTAYIMLKDSGAYSNVVSADGSLLLEADQGQNLANSSIRFSVDASEKMRLLSSGNLGIDRTNPLYKLHVYHPTTNVTAQFESGDNQAWISVRDNGYTTYGAMLGCDNANGESVILADNSATKRFSIDESGNIKFHSYGAGYLKTDANGVIGLDTVTSVVDGTGTASYIPKWSDSDTLTDSVIYESSGSIGIGITSPDYKLHVAGDVRADDLISSVSSGGTLWFTRPDNSVNTDNVLGMIKFGNSGDTGYENNPQSAIISGVASAAWSPTSTPSKLQFYTTAVDATTATERLVITSDGSVGIGETSPAHKLTIDTGTNDIYFDEDSNINQGTGSSDQPAIYADSVLRIRQRIELWDDNDGNNYLDIRDGSTQAIKLTPDGDSWITNNLGIGTTSPTPKLHLVYSGGTYSTDATSGFINQADTGRATMRLRSINDEAAELFFDINGGIQWDISARPSSQGNELRFYRAAATPSYGNVNGHTLALKQDGTIQFPLYGAGFIKSDASGNLSVDTTAYTAAQTLDEVTDLGNTTTNSISVGEVTLSNAPASNNGTFVKVYSDNHKRMYTATLNFDFTAAGTYNFNLVFPNSGGYQYELTAVNSRNGLYRNFGTLKDSSYIYWESDEDFTHRAEGDLHMISSYTGGMYFSADTTYFLSDGVTDSVQTGTANWSYAIVRYSIYIPRYDGDVTGSWKLHLTTYGDTGSGSPQFVLA